MTADHSKGGMVGRIPAVVASFILLASTSPSSAEAAVSTLLVQASAVTPEVIDYVAEVGQPIHVTAVPGESLAEVVERACGYLDEDYLALLRQRGMTEAQRPYASLSVSVPLELPACLSLEPTRVEKRQVGGGDTLWEYFRRDSAGFSRFGRTGDASLPLSAAADYVTEVSRLNPHLATPDRLVPGSEILVPRSLAWASLRLRDGTAPEEAVGRLFTHLAQGGQTLFRAEGPEALTLYSRLSREALQMWDDCLPLLAGGPLPEVFDREELTAVLAEGVAWLRRNNRNPIETFIAIPDTGLAAGMEERFGLSKVDFSSWRQPWFATDDSSFGDRHHGTYVASVALGGAYFMKLLEGLGVPLKVAPINVFEDDAPFRAELDRFNSALDAVGPQGGIVNLSVGRQREIEGIKLQIEKGSASMLFVAAAGNDGRSLPLHQVYPAMNGGAAAETVITVAALDLDGTLAAFSNRGASYVDLAAPGCLDTAMEFDDSNGEVRHVAVSGTSFAAPLVSFTAGLLRSLWPRADAAQLKQRILVSADLDPKLDPNDVHDRRRLSIEKALSIHHDVVDATVDGELRRIRGRIDDDPDLVAACGRDFSIRGSQGPRLRKVAKFDGELLVYWEDANERLQSCRTDSFSLKITDDLTQRVHELDESSLVDVVFTEREFL